MKRMLALMVLLLAVAVSPSHSTESNSEEFSSTGVPCYLHPAADGCHYTLRPGSDSCTSPSEKRRVSAGILQVNRTLASLEHQLIRLGVIPPDNACSELPPVENGGVLYSDLNLPPGTTARYICDTGFYLQSLRQGRHEFACTEDGVWDGNVTMVPVQCQLSAERCDPPDNILNGNISFTNGDSGNILVGDVITYSCELGTELLGPAQRFCLRTGNWSGSEPSCQAVDVPKDDPIPASSHTKAIGGGIGGSLTAILLAALVATLLGVGYKYRSRLKRKLTGHVAVSNLEVSDDNSEGASARTSGDDEATTIKYKSPFAKKTYRATQTFFDDIKL